MHIPGLFYVICLLIILFALKFKYYDKRSIRADNIFGTVAILTVCLIIWMYLSFVFTIDMGREKSNERSETIEIAAMRGGSSIQGSVSLFSGYVGTEAVYNFMQKMSDGSMHLERIGAKNCYIFEDDIKSGYLIRQDIATKRKEYGNIRNFFLFDFPHKEYWENGVRYEFHVPKGSVVQGINIDPKDFK